MILRVFLIVIISTLAACHGSVSKNNLENHALSTQRVVSPVLVTEAVQFDTDDPAIWINARDTAKSLIIGTDKDENGALYVFDLQGKIVQDKVVRGLKRPNNVDIEYGLKLGDSLVDIAVITERMTHKLRIFSLPDMKAIDGGGLEMFVTETGEGFRDLMGISLYKNPLSKKIYAIVGRKSGPAEGYLWQYELEGDARGIIKATLVRKFGKYSGTKEIESIAVDDQLGYVYYSDEGVGIRKYYADPSRGNNELALFGTRDFAQDHEGISIYLIDNETGYILVSDQQSNRFQVFPREGVVGHPHQHELVKIINTATLESDGSEVTSVSLPGVFSSGLFVAMSTDKTFQLYRWKDLAGSDLLIAARKKEISTLSLKKQE